MEREEIYKVTVYNPCSMYAQTHVIGYYYKKPNKNIVKKNFREGSIIDIVKIKIQDKYSGE
jgi:hypothetical protein